MGIKLILKSSPISILGFLADTSCMALLGSYTHVSLRYQVYISSMVRIILLFIGHNLWTFKGSETALWKRASKFFTWEIASLWIITEIILAISNYIRKVLHNLQIGRAHV